MSEAPITIDGSMGEGGGQVLRSALSLSLVTGRPLRLEHIRARRKRPGLRRQHLTAVQAAAQVGRAEVRGAELYSSELLFRPSGVWPGEFHFSIGTAGSVTLVLQTVLPALMLAPGPSTVVLEGGTHNPMCPPFDFLDRVFLPCLRRMGPRVELDLVRPGFFPVGGGRLRARIGPALELQPLELVERGALRKRRARAVVADLPRHIAERELSVVGKALGWRNSELRIEETADSAGPGNILMLELEYEHVSEVCSGFGQKGVRAETVARRAVKELQRYLASDAPVGEHLADQLLLPLALAGRGVFRTTEPTLHTRTNIEVIRKFLGVRIELAEESQASWRIEVGRG